MLDYKILDKLGEGSYGVVYLGQHNVTGQKVAIKQIRDTMGAEGISSYVLREITLLKELSHVNIVQLIDNIVHRGILYLIFEYIEMDLIRYMTSLRSIEEISPKQVKSYMYQIASGLAHCHSRRVVHRDLKPHNLLVDRNGWIKIADFGMARALSLPVVPNTNGVVTLWYRAPELLLGVKQYSFSMDVWSLGCIFAELLTASPLFPGETEIETLFKIFRILGTPSQEEQIEMNVPDASVRLPQWEKIDLRKIFPMLCGDGMDLMIKMLTYNPKKRINACDVLKHSYFTDIQISDEITDYTETIPESSMLIDEESDFLSVGMDI